MLYTERKAWDEYFFDIARLVSTRATCRRRKVGCVIVHNKRIISTGYNGAGEGQDHCLDVGCFLSGGSCRRAIHAEDNAIRYIQNNVDKKRDDYIAYVTVRPCENCQSILDKYCIITKYAEEYK